MKRKPVSRRVAKKIFKRGANKTHPKNSRPVAKRGGFRL